MFGSASRQLIRAVSQATRSGAVSAPSFARQAVTPIVASSRMAFSTSPRAYNSKDEKNPEQAGNEAFEVQLKEKDAKIKELHEQILYGKADYQNLQRRSTEEKSQAGDYAITKLAKDLTSSIDILGLALRSVPEELRTAPKDLDLKDPRRVTADLYSGVELTFKSMIDMLRTHGITQFDPTGEKFDPKKHEALYQAPMPGKEPDTVLECSKLGYKIKDRLLRAAEVGVVQG